MSWIDSIRVRGIQRAQRNEIVRFLQDGAFAARMARNPAYARIADWLDADHGSCVLEVGCGPGRFVALLAGLGFKVVGIDPSSSKTWALFEGNESITLKDRVYAEALPFEDGSFDLAACISTLEYTNDPAAALGEIRRVLRTGGRLVVRTVNRDNLYTRRTNEPPSPTHRGLFSRDELCDLMTDVGFRVSETFTWGLGLPFMRRFLYFLDQVVFTNPIRLLLSGLVPEAHRGAIVVFAEAGDGECPTGASKSSGDRQMIGETR